MKECPDLTVLSLEKKRELWQENDPRQMRSLGDRLLAESLPHVEPSLSREDVADQAYEARQRLGWSHEELCEAIGVTPELLLAWEEDRVRSPESLPYVVERLRELVAGEIAAASAE